MVYESPAAKLSRLRAAEANQPAPLSDHEVDMLRSQGKLDTTGDWAIRGNTVDSPTGPMDSVPVESGELHNTSLQTSHDYHEYFYRLDRDTQKELEGQWGTGDEGDFRRAIDKHSKQGSVTEAAGATAPGTHVVQSEDASELSAELRNLQTMAYSPAVAKRKREIANKLNELSPAEHLEGTGIW